ncbi:endonuclease/exonuclease/phosphatase family protein [Spirosoma harenae]
MRSILFSLSSLLAFLWLASSCSKKLNTSGKSEENQLRVMSYNIHHANPPASPNVIDLDAIAAVIRAQQPDVVMLQELDVHTGRSGKNVDEAAELGAKTGLKSYFVKSIDHDGGDYGVAILSKYEMTNLRRIRIPTDSTTKGEPRILGLATITLPNGKPITVACTHLDAQRPSTNRNLQAAEIARVLKQETNPVILAGDFNDTPDSETLRLLTSVVTSSCQNCPPTIPVEKPTKTIDFITFAPKDAFRVVQHRVIPERVASDHLPVVAVLTY